MSNTKLEFLYRDADGKNVWNAAVVKGTVSHMLDVEKEIMHNCLIDSRYFYPQSIGLPVSQAASSTGGYTLHEFIGFVEMRDTPPTVDKTMRELVNDFLNGKAIQEPQSKAERA